MVAQFQFGRAAMFFEGEPEAIADAIRGHVLGALRGQMSVEMSITVPLTGEVISVPIRKDA